MILGNVRLRLELHLDLGWASNARPTVPGGKSFDRRCKHGRNKTNCGRRYSGRQSVRPPGSLGSLWLSRTIGTGTAATLIPFAPLVLLPLVLLIASAGTAGSWSGRSGLAGLLFACVGKLTVASPFASSSFPILACYLGLVLTLTTGGTTSTWFSSSLRRSLMLVRAVFFGATAFVPCDAVPLRDEWSLLPIVVDCWSGRSRTSKAVVDPVTVRLEPFPPEVPLYSINKVFVGMILSSFFSTIVDFNVMLNGLYVLYLFIEQGFQDWWIRWVSTTGIHRVPVRNESSQFSPLSFTANKYFNEYVAPCLIFVLKKSSIINRTCRPLTGRSAADSSLKVLTFLANSPEQMFDSADNNFASRVVNPSGPTKSAVTVPFHTLLIHTKALSGVFDAARTASRTLIFQSLSL